MSLSINQQKRIRSLAQKKIRSALGLFLVEGDKMVREVLHPTPGSIPFKVESLVATKEWLSLNEENLPARLELTESPLSELRKVSMLQEPNQAIAVVQQMEYRPDVKELQDDLVLGLENIQDPGNLGSIIRIADWFGIRDIFCSGECVELYNPKVIQSTMGSFLRVRVHYLDLAGQIAQIRAGGNQPEAAAYPVFGTGSNGENIHQCKLPGRGMILLGNESRGLSEQLLKLSGQVLSIPHHDPAMHPESLNIATAAAILCAEFRRQAYSK